MKNNETDNGFSPKVVESQAAGLPIVKWALKYKWHILFWIGYFIYAYLTDKLTYDNYIYFSKEIILVGTHPLYLFYSFLYCFHKFDRGTPAKFVRSILYFVIAIGLFWLMRVLTNYRLYPVMDMARGLEKEHLVTRDFILNGLFWVTEFLIKAAFFFYTVKYIKKERQFRVVLSEKLEQEKDLAGKRIEQELAVQQQKEYERREAMFINLVHETKTPITLINNYITDHIDQHGTTPELEVVQRNINKLSRDVTNLFDLERFRRGVDMFNHNQRVDFSVFLNSICDLFEPYCDKKSIRLSRIIQNQVMISADPTALTRIANNLIENAIKYSPSETEILITLSASRGIVSFAICDQGQGIAQEDLETIFIPYHLLNIKKKNFQGMGLGLPMVNNIVETLDGEISISNNEHDGTTVTVLLPVGEKVPLTEMGQPEMYTDLAKENETIRDTDISRDSPIVLVVEDNRELNDYLVRKLGNKLNVRSALNGADALAKIKAELPDLIISDVMMDNMDGFEFAKIIKETPSFSHLPIIFLTAKSTDVDRMKGLALGAIDYIQKPFFTTGELITKIESILNYAQNRELKLYKDLYRTMKQLSRSNDWHEDLPTEDISFERRCEALKLTTREAEIAKWLVKGKSAKEIAEATFISERTVNAHARHIYEKAGVGSKTELINLFLK